MIQKQIILIFGAIILLPITASAQSCDAAYPENIWVNEWEGWTDARPYGVEIEVKRVTEPNAENHNRQDCGYITVVDNKTQKTILSGYLTYCCKGLNNNMSNGIYFFNIAASDGTTPKIGLKRTKDGMEMVSMTGAMANHPFIKEKFFEMPGRSGTWIPVGAYATTEKELLDNLRGALKDYDKDRAAERTRGFGNVRTYINAHAKLNPLKPKYAKPKANVAIDVRKTRNKNAASLGKLKVGQTLPVVDEYDGWCQVRISESEFGWVPLSAVTLTNVQGVAAVIK